MNEAKKMEGNETMRMKGKRLLACGIVFFLSGLFAAESSTARVSARDDRQRQVAVGLLRSNGMVRPDDETPESPLLKHQTVFTQYHDGARELYLELYPNGANMEIVVGKQKLWYKLRYDSETRQYQQCHIHDMGSAYLLSMAIGDVLGDAEPELVVLTGEDIEIFSCRTNELLRTLPIAFRYKYIELVDLDGNGKKEFVLCGGTYLSAVNVAGQALWNIPEYNSEKCFTAQMDDDPGMEVALTSGYVIDVDSRSVEWRMPQTVYNDVVGADIDNDGRAELIMPAYGTIYCYDVFTRQSQATLKLRYRTIALTDCDNDGTLELLVNIDGVHDVLAYDTRYWTLDWRLMDAGSELGCIKSGDVDNDGNRELVWAHTLLSDGNAVLTILDAQTRKVEWRSLGMNYTSKFAEPQLYDFTGDGVDEIILGCLSSYEDFTPAPRFIFLDSRDYRIRAISPVLAYNNAQFGGINFTCHDVDRDGRAELVVSGYSGFVAVYEVSPSLAITQSWVKTTPPTRDCLSGSTLKCMDTDGNGYPEIFYFADHRVRAMNYPNGTEKWISTYFEYCPSRLYSADFDRDGQIEVAAFLNGFLYVMNSADGQLEGVLGGAYSGMTWQDGYFTLWSEKGDLWIYRFDGSSFVQVVEQKMANYSLDGVVQKPFFSRFYFVSSQQMHISASDGGVLQRSIRSAVFDQPYLLFLPGNRLLAVGSYYISVLPDLPSLHLVAPNGGEQWAVNSRQTIRWQADASIPVVKLAYSVDSGASWNPIVAATPASQPYEWMVPAAAALRQVQLKVSDAANPYNYDIGDFPFTAAGIRLLGPNGGESWQKGGMRDITWESSGIAGTVTLELWRNGAKVGTIAEGLALTPASYSWTVGSHAGGSAVDGGGYTVRIVGAGVSDESDAPFTLWSPGLTVTSPNGGETWTRHDTRSIQWTSQGLSGNVKVELLRNGSAVGVIAGSIPVGNGEYKWDVGLVNGVFPAAGNTYSIRVSTTDNAYSDTGDAAFSIANRPPALPAASDFNGDGKTDIFWRYYGTGGFNCVWLMGQTGSPVPQATAFAAPPIEMENQPGGGHDGEDAMERTDAPQWPANMADAPFAAAVDDVMDGDGPHADPPVADPRTLGYARNLPTAGPLAWRMGGVADFDGDGWVDILWRNYTDGRNVVWCMNGLTIRAVTQLQQVATSLNWEIGGVGDFNADGRTDIVWRNYTNGRNVIWLMDRFTIKQVAALPSETDANWRITGVCDFTGDGNPDILWRHIGDGRNLVWQMNRVNQAGTVSLPTVANLSWEMAACGDFTGDGEMDLVWRNTADGRVVVWKMDRFSLMSTIQLNPVSDPNWKIENN